MKRTIGIAAAVIGVIDLFVWIIMIFTGAMFDGFGFSSFALVIFLLWFVCIGVAAFCLLGDIIRFVGKNFSAGYHSATPTQSANGFCTACGKQIAGDMAFCPYCGQKRV